MKIAILGGSFDPIHCGHLQIAKQALKLLNIDEVWFMPTKDTPLKDKPLTPFNLRAKMISFAIQPYRHMKLCTMENDGDGKSYTIQTVEKLQNLYPNDSFSWLIGTDQVYQLDQWKEIDILLSRIPFYVFSRETTEIVSPYPLTFVQMPLIDVSSTEVREGKKLHYVPYKVRNFIGEHRLYIESMVQQTMNEHRYQHSCSVANLCVELARIHHEDVHKAYACGMFHDVCKQWPYERAELWMRHLETNLVTEHPNIWHGYIASKYVKRYYHVYDRDILYAIRHHVKGCKGNKLAMILYIADKLDPQRGYDVRETIALCKRDLYKGFDEVLKQQQSYLQKTLPKGVENE